MGDRSFIRTGDLLFYLLLNTLKDILVQAPALRKDFYGSSILKISRYIHIIIEVEHKP